jgi:uncharacterized protein YkwD
VGIGSIRIRLAVAFAAVAVMAPVSDAAASGCPGAARVPSADSLGTAREATLCLLNKVRRSHGMKKIRHNRKLADAATQHSQDMVRREFFDHVAPGGVTLTERVLAANYLTARMTSSWMLAENIGWGTGSFGSPKGMVRQWMESPGHRANILNPKVRDAGIGIAVGNPSGADGATYTLDLGRN